MTETTLSLDGLADIRLLFGPQDQYLRQIRNSIGIDVVFRGDELRLIGDDAAVRQGIQIFTRLREIVGKKGQLLPSDVRSVINGEEQNAWTDDISINLFERAKKVHPRTPGQADYIRAIEENEIVFCCGPAGCGKTYLAVAMAVNALRREQVRRIVLVRPAVEAGEKLGFLPGDMIAKVNPYLRPLLDAMNDILDFDIVKRYMENDVIEVVPLAFMRGRTLNDTYIILDEGQNTTVTQMKMFLTRMGNDSRIVVTGDITQTDLQQNVDSGLVDAMQRLSHIPGVMTISLTGQDIVRHPLVREVVHAYDESPATASSPEKTPK